MSFMERVTLKSEEIDWLIEAVDKYVPENDMPKFEYMNDGYRDVTTIWECIKIKLLASRPREFAKAHK